MATATLNKINEAIAKHGVEVVKGNGYFYFANTGEEYLAQHVPSVYSAQPRCMSLEEWIAYVDDAVKTALYA